MAKKNMNINKDTDNSIYSELVAEKELYEEGGYDNIIGASLPNIDLTGLPAAKSQWSTGRNCPKCKNTLKIVEIADSERASLLVECSYCNQQYWTDDLESTTTISDSIHRSIPDSLILSYMEDRKRD